MTEYYLVREADDAHAIVDCDTADAVDLDDAIKVVRQLWQTLDMTPRPDAIPVSDRERCKLYSCKFSAPRILDERPPP